MLNYQGGPWVSWWASVSMSIFPLALPGPFLFCPQLRTSYQPLELTSPCPGNADSAARWSLAANSPALLGPLTRSRSTAISDKHCCKQSEPPSARKEQNLLQIKQSCKLHGYSLCTCECTELNGCGKEKVVCTREIQTPYAFLFYSPCHFPTNIPENE